MNPAWTIENYLEVKNNRLHINGVSATALAEQCGTPLFVFSETRIRHNIERLKRAERAIDCPLKICYAAKANSNMAILRAVKDAGGDLEVNSGGELFKALKIGFKPEQIIFNGTSKTKTELEEAIEAGIYAIQADSFYEIELIEIVAQRLNKRANVSLRLVPEIESDTLHGLQTALLTSKFGMMPDEALTAFRRWKSDDKFLNLCGIHLHIGSQNPKSESYSEALQTLFENLREINAAGHRLSHLNLGGGFPVNYLRDQSNAGDLSAAQRDFFAAELEPETVLREAWKVVKQSAAEAKIAHLLGNIELLIEPGRSVIGDAGVCLTTVRNRKERPVENGNWKMEIGKLENSESTTQNLKSEIQNDVWLLTDAGFNILLSMETYKWYYHLVSAERAGEAHATKYKLAGPLCDGGDVYFDIEGQNRLPDYRLLPENVEPNEVLALLNCGAYSIAQMFQYNGRQLPAIVLLQENGEVELIRKRDSYEDLLINDVW
ncbi:MAG: diaminopimelate decarboxylase [Pyrinomonadaceae bacterium]|nr:diaminopimelate decarboxylase [Pyrinomonadaceae bacterium]